MTVANFSITPRIAEFLTVAERLTPTERLFIARWLLDSLLAKKSDDAVDWQALGLSAFEQEWDNAEDAIYDEWRAHDGVLAR